MSLPGLKHPGRWLWLLLLAPILIGFVRLRLDFDVLNLLPQDNPSVRGLKIYQEHFTSARELVLAFRSEDPEALERYISAAGGRLRQKTNLVASAAWKPPWQEHPGDLAELLGWIWLNQPQPSFTGLSIRITRATDQLAAAREQLATSLSPDEIARLSYDPLGFTRLPEAAGLDMFSGDKQQAFSNQEGTFRLMFVQANQELVSYKQCDAWLTGIRKLLSTVPGADTPPGLEIGFTGRPAFVAEIGRGMQRDMKWSVIGTALIIAVLFWIAHRTLKPLLWLLVLLGVILAGTLGLGGFAFGSINVVSMGFAAILLGLSVDYALLHYQEAVSHPHLTVPEIRRVIAPGVAWAAMTTIMAFLSLNLGGMPGLAELGSMVGIGVAFGALVIVFEYLPPLFPERAVRPGTQPADKTGTPNPPPPLSKEREASDSSRPPGIRLGLAATLVLLALILAVLATALPGLDTSANALRPRNSMAYATLAEVQRQFASTAEPLWLIVSGSDDRELLQRTDAVQAWAARAKASGRIAEFTLPNILLHNPDNLRANLDAALQLSAMTNSLRTTAARAGFEQSALGLAEAVLSAWNRTALNPENAWPTNQLSQWILSKTIARTPTNVFALGLLHPSGNARASLAELSRDVPEGAVITSWGLLGESVLHRVQHRLWLVVAPMLILVLGSLVLAFRRVSEVLLSLASLSLSGLCLIAFMRITGWSWDLMNLMAIPLILGTGVDYGIFIQMALRRHMGNLRVVLRSTGRALLLCAGTAIAGFGSLAFSSNAGLSSLGRVCAAGIAFNVVVAVALLPIWWLACWRHRNQAGPTRTVNSPDSRADALNISGPSSLYNAKLWIFGIWLVRVLPASWTRRLATTVTALYYTFHYRRRRIVESNLLPVYGGDRVQARRATRSLFRNFGLKVADLLHYESGQDVARLLAGAQGFEEHLAPLLKTGRGVLLLTFHLGNWEFGALWLAREKVKLNVLTQEEPGKGLTELRQAARKSWNIRTVVVGRDPFAFVQVIRELEDGAVFALLMDRPPPTTSLKVHFFHQPFAASVSAAELARASGCALLPVCILLENGCYSAHVLPEIPYERASLRHPDHRANLTREIMSRFEPIVLKHADQWYHFVPLWNK